MPESEGHTVQTRASVLQGMQVGDEDRWQQFYRLYAPVLRAFALKAGLTEVEADEVVQETCIGVARNIGKFRYNPQVCRFKSWLLNLASWRVKNQLAKRRRWEERVHPISGQKGLEIGNAKPGLGRDPDRTATVERLADPSGETLDSIWEQEWQSSLFQSAMDQVRRQFSATQFQIFDLYALKEWPAREVAICLGVSLATIYLAKHRIATALKKETARLEQQMNRGW